MLLDLFPLNTVLFPGSAMPLRIFEPRYLAMVGQCLEGDRRLGIILLRKGRAEGGGEVEIHEVGTVAEIMGANHRPDGSVGIQIVGRERFLVREVTQRQPRLIAEVDLLEWYADDARAEAVEELRREFGHYWRRLLEATGQWSRQMSMPDSPRDLAETVGAGVQIDASRRQLLLEQRTLGDLVKLELEVLRTQIPKLLKARAAREQRRTN